VWTGDTRDTRPNCDIRKSAAIVEPMTAIDNR
jgi:hypothetical protein